MLLITAIVFTLCQAEDEVPLVILTLVSGCDSSKTPLFSEEEKSFIAGIHVRYFFQWFFNKLLDITFLSVMLTLILYLMS